MSWRKLISKWYTYVQKLKGHLQGYIYNYQKGYDKFFFL